VVSLESPPPYAPRPPIANGTDASRDLGRLPSEPLEAIEPSAPSSVKGQLYGDRDGSAEESDRTAARVSALGIEAPLYKRFPCVLNGHEHLARVHPTRCGFWQYRCEGLPRSVGLAEVRAMIAYGQERRISRLEAARWGERLDYEAAVRWPIPLDVRLPEQCPEPALIVATWMRIFVGLRDTRFPPSEPFVFAREFAQAYCLLSPDRVRSAKDWLQRAGVVHRVGRHGRAALWRLAAQDQPEVVNAIPKRDREYGVTARDTQIPG
jgi:hypothetical protein